MTRHLNIFALFVTLLIVAGAADAAEIERFFGSYTGSAELVIAGEAKERDMSAVITETEKGFNVSWTSVSYKDDGRSKAKSYSIDFDRSGKRENVFRSAMKTSVFGKRVPLDPMDGEPYVWARLVDDTLSVFSLFINEEGEYEMQEFHRTLAEGGLNLVFRRVFRGEAEKEIRAFLSRDD